jgi:alginate O-acetyltransferase complex protein AlgI
MIFTEARFIVFFAVVFAVHWALGSNRPRKWWLLLASYVFYGVWDWRFLSLLLLSTQIDYVVGARIGRSEDPRARKGWLVTSLVAQLGILGYFKYYNFFATSAADFLGLLGFQANPATIDVILPWGISFYTFQTMSYTLDVYRRAQKPIASWLDFATFVAFFPQLVAGPIVRAVEFLPQLEGRRDWKKHVDVRACLSLFLIGYLKKAVLADQVAMAIDPAFLEPAQSSVWGTWLSMMLFSIQIYGDFSGYSDMAIATAALLGYRLPDNFYFPYLATNIAQFWQRWHISLTTWIRDYVFVSIDKASHGAGRPFNTLFTFTLVGFWHGASWNFVLFGFMHGVYLVLYGLWTKLLPRRPRGPLAAIAGNLLMMVSLGVSLVLFKCPTWDQARTMLAIAFGLRAPGAEAISSWWFVLLLVCLGVHWLSYKEPERRSLAGLPDWLYAFGYGAAWALVLPWAAQGYTPFIYFQF